MDKYHVNDFLPNIVIHNKMTGWETRDPRQGYRILPSGWFPYGFNIVGRLRPLHEAGQAVGLQGRWAY